MKAWLRRRLDAYEGRHEQRDEEFAALVNRHIDALSQRRTLQIYLAILATANALIWLSVILFPRDIRDAWTMATDVNDRIGLVILAVIFGLGMWLTYSVFRLKVPDLEDHETNDEILASYSYSLHSTRRWRIWLISVIGGVLNVLLIVIVDIFLSSGL